MEQIFLSIMGLIFAFIVLCFAASWKVYTKAGKAGWAAFIPIYNLIVMLQIIGKPGWWLLMYFIPVANIIVTVLVAIELAKSFGKSETFGIVFLFLLAVIGYFILAFGDAKYVGPGGLPQTTSTPPVPPVDRSQSLPTL